MHPSDKRPASQSSLSPASPLPRRRLGRTAVEVSALGFGGAPLGNLYKPLSEEDAAATIKKAAAGGITLFDTAPWYGHGLSEHRLGTQLRQLPRERLVVSTKVGRVFTPGRDESHPSGAWVDPLPFEPQFDYTAAGIRRSHEDSLMRLGLDRVDVLLVHDLDLQHHGADGVADRLTELDGGGGWRELEKLRDRGQIRAVGAGINEVDMIVPLVTRYDLDVLMVAMPYTLLDQTLLGEAMDLCVERNVALLIGSPFGSGILATGTGGSGRYGYRPPSSEVVDRVQRLEAICARHDVPLRAAALQFPLGHPLVSAVLPGAGSVAHVENNISMLAFKIPDGFWTELKEQGLLPADALTPRRNAP